MDQQKPGTFFFCLIIFSCLLLLSPLPWFGFGTDQGLHAYGAWAWRHYHLAPYVGCFDHNFPGIFIIHYLTQMIFGESVLGFRVFDLIWQVATALMISLVSCSVFKNRFAGFLAAVFYSITYINMGAWDTGQRDGFLLLPYLLGYWFLTRPEAARAKTIAFAFSGLLIGFAFLFKPVAALVGILFAALAWKRSKSGPAPIIFYMAGCLLPFAVIVLYYWRLGALAKLFQAIFAFNSEVYSGALRAPPLLVLGGIFMMRFWINSAQVLLGLLLLALLLARSKKILEFERGPALWLFFLFAGVYLGYLSQGKYYAYQQTPVWGMLCLFSGVGWAAAFDGLAPATSSFRKIKAVIFSLILLALSGMLIEPGMLRFLAKLPSLTFNQGYDSTPYFFTCRLAASYLQNHTRPGQKAQVWGSEALINYLAQRQAPSRFPSTLSLIFRPGPDLRAPLQKKLGAELLESLKNDAPAYFLVETVSHPGYGIKSDKAILLGDYPEIWNFVSERYSPAYNIKFLDGYIEFYRLKSLPDAPAQSEQDQE